MKIRAHSVLSTAEFISKAIKEHPTAVKTVTKLLKEASHSLDDVSRTQLDFWAACFLIPKGYAATYGTLAKIVQGTRGEDLATARLSRIAGRCMAENPIAPVVPCHRVVGSNGHLTGFKGETSSVCFAQKAKLLRSEGVAVTSMRGDTRLVTVDRRTNQLL